MKKQCRFCGNSAFKKVIDFGKAPLWNSLLNEQEAGTEKTYPLKVVQCQTCGLVQTEKPIDTHSIYTAQDYLYFSSDMPNLKEYFGNYATEIKQRFLDTNNVVVEIGANDGLMLEQFCNDGYKPFGVDPATNTVVRALARGIPVLAAPFNNHWANWIFKELGEAKVIYGNNCIAHIDDLKGVMEGVTALLAHDGVFIVECNYWGAMVANTNFALIYHDHFSYFSLEVWSKFLKQFGMEVFDAVVTSAQGGSLRFFACREGKYEKTAWLHELEKEEIETQLNTHETCKQYEKAVVEVCRKLYTVVDNLMMEGKIIAGYGAAAKGLSALQLAKIGSKHIKYFVDDSPAKQGKITPVEHIKIISRTQVPLFGIPDYFIISAPNYKDVIIKKEQEYIANGGKFITLDGEVI